MRGDIAIVALMLAVGAAGVQAQTANTNTANAETHKAWMNDAADQQDELREALAAKSAAKSATAAAKLADLMKQTETYWAGKKAPDIVTLAVQARRMATETGAAAKAGKFDQAHTAFGKMNATCNACHDLHPEKR
jgi:hypothetical protein